MGSDIIAFVKQWWRGNMELDDINRICVVLIPKYVNPKRIMEFRPISYCNMMYKIIPKTMANMLKPFFG